MLKLTAQPVENLKSLMQRHQINQSELARRAKLPLTTLNRLLLSQSQGSSAENADYSPTVDMLAAIARALGVSVDDLIGPLPPQTPGLESRPDVLARRLSRLVMDFCLCGDEGQLAILEAAARAADGKGP